ncbi:MAG: type II toxin-antitoxin system Phd/YefM family antitoxin [Deltaproteobacteria bacterium]|nr:type II toxin-antitoxin system Phd/YefM family antitoxin [Deltaproteobacteria bacterium]MBI4374688.1 type II toxin-antitoxin system Phd/YefM family antitoxin [Deltaproteobacteria bacterium]
MISVDEKTTLFGVTDLRTEMKQLLKALKHSRVVITERNTPRAVVLDYEDYQRMKDLVELAEEGIDAIEIESRRKKTKKFLTHEQALKELSLIFKR